MRWPAGCCTSSSRSDALELAVAENPGLAFDLAKTLVESVCRAVLGERSIAFDEADDLPKLFKTASNHLPFLAGLRERRCRDSQEPRPDAKWPEHRDSGHLRAAQSVRLRVARGGRTPPGDGVGASTARRRGRRHDRRLPSPRPPPGPDAAAFAASAVRREQAFNDSVDETHGPDSDLRDRVQSQRSPLPDGAGELPDLRSGVRRGSRARLATSADAPPEAAS